jgi:mono/diheme cytochrome c family protein
MNGINLSAAEIQLISDYLNSGGVTKPTDGPGLYAAYCENCHGVNGSGGPEGGVRGASESEINRYINNEPDMQSLGSLLTSQEIGLIAEFLNGN